MKRIASLSIAFSSFIASWGATETATQASQLEARAPQNAPTEQSAGILPSPTDTSGPMSRAESVGTDRLSRPTPETQPVAQNNNQWRYRWHNGRWWYWMPNRSWVVWNGATWTPYRSGVVVTSPGRTYAGTSRYYYNRPGYYYGGPRTVYRPNYGSGFYGSPYSYRYGRGYGRYGGYGGYGGYYGNPWGYGNRYYGNRNWGGGPGVYIGLGGGGLRVW